ncbi:MAG: hypothetical protein WC430_00950 [Patescibacteria group bacterium]
MKILRQYQLDIVFLFFATMVILGVFFFMLEYFGANPQDYEWIIGAPLIAFYCVNLWNVRQKINISDRRKLTAKSLVYWVTFGIILFETYSNPLSVREYLSLNLLFVAFTIFLADSYWDFKKITFKDIFCKKNYE